MTDPLTGIWLSGFVTGIIATAIVVVTTMLAVDSAKKGELKREHS